MFGFAVLGGLFAVNALLARSRRQRTVAMTFALIWFTVAYGHSVGAYTIGG